MKEYGGMILLFGIVTICIVSLCILIQMPFDEQVSDDDDAYVTYHIAGIEKKNGRTEVTINMVNHGYANCRIGSYEIVYVTEKMRAGEKASLISNGSINADIKQAKNGEAFSMTLRYDTDDDGYIKMLTPRYRMVEY